jgi:hypothetical protein
LLCLTVTFMAKQVKAPGKGKWIGVMVMG